MTRENRPDWLVYFFVFGCLGYIIHLGNVLESKDARIKELCDLCNQLTIENVDLKQAATNE
jgi:hypothetical protein